MPKYPHFLEEKIKLFNNDFIEPRKNKKFLVLGKQPNSESIILNSNDYLAICNNPDINTAQIEFIKKYNNDVLMSAIFFQGDNYKSRFEKDMAEFLGVETTILCQSGWVANIGLVQAIATQNTPCYIDFYAHMSMWEGINSAGAKAHPFPHNNMAHLEKLIQKYGSGIILVDAIYSTNGDICPLGTLVEIAERYECISIVDESHSLGIFGQQGSGLLSDLKLTNRVHFITASLSKAFATRAGIITCDQNFANYFPFVSKPAIFSSVLLNGEIIRLNAILEFIKKADKYRKELCQKTFYLKEALNRLSYNVGNTPAPIVALESGLESQTEILRDALERENIFGAVFCAPATPKKHSLVRLSLRSAISFKELDYVIDICQKIRDEVDIKSWKSIQKSKPQCKYRPSFM